MDLIGTLGTDADSLALYSTQYMQLLDQVMVGMCQGYDEDGKYGHLSHVTRKPVFGVSDAPLLFIYGMNRFSHDVAHLQLRI